MEEVMSGLRQHTPQSVAGEEVTVIEDYLAGTKRTHKTDEKLTLPKSNVLRLWLADGSKIVIRPSGTEPKMKIYIAVRAPVGHDLEQTVAQCDAHAQKLLESLPVPTKL